MNSEERKNYWDSQVKAAERALEYAREQRRKAAEALGEVVLRVQQNDSNISPIEHP